MMKLLRSNTAFAILCFAAYCINIQWCLPGFSSPDTYDQYQQAINNNYHDWHPPVMAYLWHFLLHLHTGIYPMLVWQLLLLWTSCFFIGSTLKKAKNKLICVLCFLLLPIIQNFAGYVIKDVQMAYAWLLSIAIMYWLKQNHYKINWLYAAVCFVLITYGTWLRYNAIFALLPICFIWLAYFTTIKSFWKLTLTAIVLLIVIINTEKLFKLSIGATKENPEQVLLMHDLSGIFVKTSKNVFPATFYQDANFDTAYIRAKYQIASFDHIWWNPDNKTIVPNSNQHTAVLLKKAWLNAIINNPFIYLQNRFATFLYYLHIQKSSNNFINYYFFQYPASASLAQGSIINNSKLYYLFTGFISVQKDMCYMQPWFWFLLNVILFGFVNHIKTPFKKLFVTCLLLSSLFYGLAQFFLCTTDTDFRYTYWNCISLSFSLFIIFSSMLENKEIKNN